MLFADDISLMSDTPRGLQHAIDVLNAKAAQYGLKININKTKVIVFRKGGFLNKDEKWVLNGERVEVVNN